ncbi:MAG: IclR family transcriptional regulator [Alicyclobacillus macrosporangiidus]|uniref:IclR family transcriptional regulator n=1 Tax=Alicyclobacillus macrosporangiidus TaxID=392015 RepID=UPI0026F10EC6|nr:IclR family transcriptional regulator [Alicyclobacillus macrosporangiidus]MCL6599557.1 IclR family transcriptional regulator [Alicyclobacillus macrosporangiidus]
MNPRPTEHNQLLQKIARILDYVTRVEGPRSMRQMAQELNIARPTLYRLLDAMVAEGLVLRVGGRYHPGPRVLHWAADALNRPEVGRLARPALQRLADETGLTASVHVRMGHCRVCVERMEGAGIVRPHVRIGESLPLHVGASGKILLAWLPQDARQELVVQSCAAYPEHPLNTPEAAFDIIRQQGWALSLGERDEALASLSAPVFGPRGDVVAALSISGVRQRFRDDQVTQWRTRVVEAAAGISAMLGGNAAPTGPRPHAERHRPDSES